jgi:hypothetical protein
MDLQNLARSSALYLVALCRAVITVDCTKKRSAPASAATGPSLAAFCGMVETAQGTPASLISQTRLATSFSCTGSL